LIFCWARTPNALTPGHVDPALIDKAVAAAMGISYDSYHDLVVDFLEEEFVAHLRPAGRVDEHGARGRRAPGGLAMSLLEAEITLERIGPVVETREAAAPCCAAFLRRAVLWAPWPEAGHAHRIRHGLWSIGPTPPVRTGS